MIRINDNYQKLQGSYLFSTIAKKVTEYSASHPDAKIIRLGIGDVTRPLTPSIIKALHDSVDEMADEKTFRGYAPDLGYETMITGQGDAISKKMRYSYPTEQSPIRETYRRYLTDRTGSLCVTPFIRCMSIQTLWRDAPATTWKRPADTVTSSTCRAQRITDSDRRYRMRRRILYTCASRTIQPVRR